MYVPTLGNERKGVKTMKFGKMFKIILSVLLVLAMLVACTPAAENNNDNNPGGSSTPSGNNSTQLEDLQGAEYLQQLLENDLDASLASFGEIYGAILSGLGNSSAVKPLGGAKLNMTLTVGDTALDLFEQAIFGGEAPVDLSFLKEINLDMDVGMGDQMQAIQVALGLKGQHIITANLLMNMADSIIHIGLPELNDQWLKLEGSEDTPVAITGAVSSPAMLAELAKKLPDAETLTKVLNRYLKLILPELKNVEQSTVKLEADGVQQECTQLTMKIYEADAMAITKAILTTAKDDADLKKIIIDVYEAIAELSGTETSGQKFYTDFQEMVASALSDMEDVEETDTENPIVVTLYVDKNHNIVGGMLKMSTQDSDRGTIYFYSLTEGDKTAFEFAIPSDVNNTDDFKISGSSTTTDGKTNGTYKIKVRDTTKLTVKVENWTVDGGTLTVTPKEDLFPAEVTDMLGTLALQIKLSADGIGLNVLGGSEVLLGIAFKPSESDGPSMEVPSDAVDVTDSNAMEQWLEKLSMDNVINNLKEAGAYEFFELLFKAVESPAQPMPEVSVNPDNSWG